MLLLYLSRHGFNGLYRVNSKGLYNVPYGRYTKVKFPRESLLNLHRKFQIAEIRHGDFEGTMRLASPGDLVYYDPAYVPLSDTANFSSYTKMGFSIEDHQRLADTARELGSKANVIASNHDTEVSRELIAARGSTRSMFSATLAEMPATVAKPLNYSPSLASSQAEKKRKSVSRGNIIPGGDVTNNGSTYGCQSARRYQRLSKYASQGTVNSGAHFPYRCAQVAHEQRCESDLRTPYASESQTA